MAIKGPARGKAARPPIRSAPRWALLGLALASASCVPVSVSTPAFGSGPTLAVATPASLPTVLPAGAPTEAAASELAAVSNGGLATAFRGRTPLDELRSLDCLAQAIYYEAASESEDGQRAVAQVVLNRVRHPAWPDSVCGVVYQGPMRPGGGCQFTFTCDGSLARAPGGASWAQARRLAAEALAGRSFAGVGLSTHYHTHAVSPSWAPRLRRTTMIGAHRFYALPGAAGTAPAFADSYSGREPLVQGTNLFARAAPAMRSAFSPTADAAQLALAAPVMLTSSTEETASPLPPSTIREEYRHSGQWRKDAPAAMTGH